MRQGPRVAVLLGWLASSAGGRAVADPEAFYAAFRSGDLVGYLDIPQGTTKLSFRLALDDYIGSDCSTTSISLTTRHGRERIALTPLVDSRTWDIPWTEVAFDLTGLDGERAVFRATPSRFTHCLPDMFELLVLDDFRLE